MTTIEHVFSADELDALVRATPSLWWRALIEFSVCTGVRVGEVLRLHTSDIDERTLARLRSEHADHSRVFVSDWILEQLWTHLAVEEPLAPDATCTRSAPRQSGHWRIAYRLNGSPPTWGTPGPAWYVGSMRATKRVGMVNPFHSARLTGARHERVLHER